MMLRTEFHIGLAMPDPEEFMEKLNIADALRMTQFVLIHMIIRHHSIALYPPIIVKPEMCSGLDFSYLPSLTHFSEVGSEMFHDQVR